jgi:dimethylargininase
MTLMAITREVAPSIVNCELSHLKREPIDYEKAGRQHRNYCQVLEELGVKVLTLPHGGFADGVFVEDPAVVVDELAVITPLGVKSRQAEKDSIAAALKPYRSLRFIESGRLEGGDVLQIGKLFYIGLSARSDEAGIESFRQFVAPHGYEVRGVPIHGCLHFKSACTYVGDNTLLLNPEWVKPEHFKGFKIIEVDAQEPFGANALNVNGTTLYSTVFPRTLKKLGHLKIRQVDNSELMKAESALTCMSLLFKI